MQTLTHSNSDEFSPSIQGLLNHPKLQHLVGKAQWLGRLTKAFQETMNDSQAAQQCVVADFKGGRLLVFVRSAAWLTRLNFMLPELKTKLSRQPLFTGFLQIVIQVQPPSSSPPVVTRSKPKLSERSAELLRQSARHINDEKLRIALEKLAQNT